MIQAFPFKPVDSNLTIHEREMRGFVTVPFDYAHPDQDTLLIFYRLLPALPTAPLGVKLPVLVVINGGPGIPSHAYRPLDFDYAKKQTDELAFDRFRFLSQHFRVLLVDQRGTDGASAPLDMENPRVNANGIARYFSSDAQAKDYGAVIEQLIGPADEFYMIAQSYGGMVGMQYLGNSELRKPKGIVFSCSALPYSDVMDAQMSRRREQLKLNLELKDAYPQIAKTISEVRNHMAGLKVDPNFIHSLYPWLGKSEKGSWEKVFLKKLEQWKTLGHDEIARELSSGSGSVNLLNYVLSSANFTPGYTDRTIAQLSSEMVPYEPWMIDENWMLMQSGEDAEWKKAWVAAMDEVPPPPTPFPAVSELRTAISQTQVLFTAADNDAFVPKESYLRSVEKYEVAGHTQVKTLPGGHHAIFLKEGAKVLLDWLGERSSDSSERPRNSGTP